MGPPLVAVPVPRLAPGRVAGWHMGAFGLPESYADCLRRAGGRPVLLTAPDDADPEEILGPFDGLLLIGGGDIEPARYEAEPHAEIYGVEPARDDLEVRLLRAADALRVPTLAVCRGIQVLNVAFGGTLLQHLPDVPDLVAHGAPFGDPVLHDVKLQPGSRVAGATGRETVAGSSHHHQGLDRLGDGLVATGWTEDGLVEAIEREEGWTVGIQWHPEETADRDPDQQALFDALVARAGSR